MSGSDGRKSIDAVSPTRIPAPPKFPATGAGASRLSPPRVLSSFGRTVGSVLTGGWGYAVALLASFAIATLASPAGVSGAVLLLPFQVSVLGTRAPR